MKLQRYNQFVKRINEERESGFKSYPEPVMDPMVDDEEGYDTVDDFRKEMDETDEIPMTDFDTEVDMDDEDMDTDLDMDDEDMDAEVDMDDAEVDMDDEDMDTEVDMDDEDMGTDLNMDDEDEAEMPSDYSGVDSEKKLFDLAQMLGVEVVDNEVKFGDQVVNYYSETGNLHIGSKEFETAKEAADYLQGGTPRMMRDTNESRSYRFNRRRK